MPFTFLRNIREMWPLCVGDKNKQVPGLTFRILHLCVLQFPSSQGWYMPRVTQLNRITVMVRRSNQLERETQTWTFKISTGGRSFFGCDRSWSTVKMPIKHNHQCLKSTSMVDKLRKSSNNTLRPLIKQWFHLILALFTHNHPLKMIDRRCLHCISICEYSDWRWTFLTSILKQLFSGEELWAGLQVVLDKMVALSKSSEHQ